MVGHGLGHLDREDRLDRGDHHGWDRRRADRLGHRDWGKDWCGIHRHQTGNPRCDLPNRRTGEDDRHREEGESAFHRGCEAGPAEVGSAYFELKRQRHPCHSWPLVPLVPFQLRALASPPSLLFVLVLGPRSLLRFGAPESERKWSAPALRLQEPRSPPRYQVRQLERVER